MYLRSVGEIVYPIQESLPELKDLVVDAVGQPMRRISRFIQLALIGAGRCTRGTQLPKDTAVYLASGRGDLEITIDVMTHVFRDGQAPKPLSFVNTVSNSAAFYVAKSLQLESRSAFVSSRYLAFEDALQLALIDFQLGVTNSALIGAVDNTVLPLDAHRERLELDVNTPLADGSHWLWFTRAADEKSLCSIVDVSSARDRDRLLQWIALQSLDKTTTLLCSGQYLTARDFAEIQKATAIENTFDYRQSRGYYASQSAAAIAAFAASDTKCQTLLHLNSDSLGRYSAMLVKRSAGH
jgi:hypothetical protein